MTACAVLASSASADSQVFTGVVNQQPGMFQPYHTNVMPINPAGYTNSFGRTTPVTLPLTHVGPALQTLNTYGMGQVTQMGMGIPAFGFGHNLIKREARLETPYTIQTRMDNPLDGSKQEVQIKVNKFGKGKSFQHVEQTDETNVMRDNYMLEHRRMAQRPLISKNRYLLAGSRPITQRGMDMNNQRGHDPNQEAMVMIKSAKPEQEDNLDYLQATKLIPKYNIRENFMAYPQNQMIHTQGMRI